MRRARLRPEARPFFWPVALCLKFTVGRPNRLDSGIFSFFFVSFATFCSDSERYHAREIRPCQQALRPNSKESPPR